MKILELEVRDTRIDWTLQRCSLDSLNLLVGISGVGKTNILRAIERIRAAALGPEEDVPRKFRVDESAGMSWDILFEHAGKRYRWEVERGESRPGKQGNSSEFLFEKLSQAGGGTLVDRSVESFVFNGQSLPLLKPGESAISLLGEREATMRPVYTGFQQFVSPRPRLPFEPVDDQELVALVSRYKDDLDALRKATSLGTVIKAYLLQELFPDEFRQLADAYSEIFPAVTGVRVSSGKEDPELLSNSRFPQIKFQDDLLFFVLREDGVGSPIPQGELSSGMLRTLFLLTEIYLAAEGSVVLVDEFENGLGVNCMPGVTDFVLERAPQLQFILTSHHPQVINEIPVRFWRLVRRSGSVVEVVNASAIPGLAATSRHKAFLRLLNLREYEEGIGRVGRPSDTPSSDEG